MRLNSLQYTVPEFLKVCIKTIRTTFFLEYVGFFKIQTCLLSELSPLERKNIESLGIEIRISLYRAWAVENSCLMKNF